MTYTETRHVPSPLHAKERHGTLLFHTFFSLWLYRPLDLSRFFSFSILYTVGRNPWTGIRLLQGHYLHTEQHKHRINAKTYMPRVGFEPTTPVLEEVKTVHALDCAITVISPSYVCWVLNTWHSMPGQGLYIQISHG
jgi:hypothetical protein